MISVADALTRVLALSEPLEIEVIALADAVGRSLAKDVAARITQPPFASSAMDGYAVKNAEAQPGMHLKILGESAAGNRFNGVLQPHTAVRIFTGAPVPGGADCIVIQEDTTRKGDTITIRATRDQASYIRPAGGDFKQGDKIAAPRLLSAADIALLAAMNIAEIPVIRKPIIALIATGDELVMPGETPGPDQIISSNNYGLKALLESQGARVRLLPIARDTPESLQQVFGMCTGVDLIVTLGGVSVGDHDLVQSVAKDQGLALDFYRVAMRPGKPLMAGRLNGIAMIGLPGNPVSAMVCGHIFLRPLLRKMLGFAPAPLARHVGYLGADISENRKRAHYMRARAKLGENGWIITAFARQDSALLSILGDSNALLVREVDAPAAKKGDKIEFIFLE